MYTINKNNINISIDESKVEIRSIKIDGKEICYQQDSNWKKNWPILFPICGKLKNDICTYNGKEYQIPKHGFFREINNWTISNESNGFVSFVAKSDGKFLDIYPFEFEIIQQFEITNDEIIVSTEIKNINEDNMLFSIGHHPAFKTRKDGVIKFENEELFFTDGFDTGLQACKPKSSFKIMESKISDLDFGDSKFYMTKNLKSTWIEYSDKDINFKVDLSDFETFLLWSESNESNYICIEPWHGTPDFEEQTNNDLKSKENIISIESNSSFVTEFKIKF